MSLPETEEVAEGVPLLLQTLLVVATVSVTEALEAG